MRLVFTNDNDAGAGNDSRFSNVRVFDSSNGNVTPNITNPGNQVTLLDSSVNLQVGATDQNSGDILTFSATDLPTGLSISDDGVISGNATALGSFNVTVTVDDGNGGSSDANFSWSIYGPNATCPDCLDFNVVTTSSHSNQDVAGNVSVADSGTTLVLTDNTWRQTDQTFNITATTMLEFDFQSTVQGEVQGIGFDEDEEPFNGDRIFRLYGTQNWGIADFATYSGGVVHYQIPVGQYYTGTAMRLVFTNDNDAGAGNDSRFSNVRVFESN